MQSLSLPRIQWILVMILICATPRTGLAIPGIGTGPAVGSNFDVISFSDAAGDAAFYVAWKNAESNVASGVLHLDDGAFDAFPTLPSGYVTNLRVGAGGAVADRRAYVTWVGNQQDLKLAAIDGGGTVVSPAHGVANSVQISPNRLAGTDTGVLIGHVWDTNSYWDPRVLEIDVSGNVLGLEVAASVVSPEQTLGTAIVADPDGSHLIGFITSDTQLMRLRRYDATGPLDPSPVTVSDDASADYVPFASIYLNEDVPSTVLLAFPYLPAGASEDVRFAIAPLSTDPVIIGPVLSDLVLGFVGRISDMAALSDPTPRAVVVWQDVVREDPETCGCSVPPIVQVNFFAQVLAVGPPITAEGPPILVYQWTDGDPVGPPITEPRVVVASDNPGRFTVAWSDGQLRFRNIDLTATAVALEEGSSRSAMSLSSHPNPFAGLTTITYALPTDQSVRLDIYDVAGRRVRTLSQGAQSIGRHTARWDGLDEHGRMVSGGVYFARLQGEMDVANRKLVLTR